MARMRRVPISEAAMQRCKRKANAAEHAEAKRGEARAQRYAAWHNTFDRCVNKERNQKSAMNRKWRGLAGGKPTLMQEFVRAGEVALEKLRRKKRKQSE